MITKIKKKIYKNNFLISSYYSIKIINNYFRFKLFSFITHMYKYIKDLWQIKTNKDFRIKTLYPCIDDNTKETPLDIDYFYQDTWAAKKIFTQKPKIHYDIGSNAKTIGLISQFTKTYMIDIRPLPIKLKGLKFIKGDILKLPFKTNSIESISSLCVIEHIGLGRYGDNLDPYGSDKAISEIIRVTKQNGNIYISLPIYKVNKIFFNAHRTFTKRYVLSKFKNCKLIEAKYIYKGKLTSKFSKNSDTYGTGLFWFKKN